MPCCAVFGCKNHTRKSVYDVAEKEGVRFYKFPTKKKFQNAWLEACRRLDSINLKSARICSEHFHDSCKVVTLKQQLFGCGPLRNKRDLREDAVPTENLPSVYGRKHRIDEKGRKLPLRPTTDTRPLALTRRLEEIAVPVAEFWKQNDKPGRSNSRHEIVTRILLVSGK